MSPEAGNIYAGTDLYFTDFNAIEGHFNLFAYNADRTARNLHFTNVNVNAADIVAGTGSVLYGTGLIVGSTNLTGFRLEGDISFRSNCSLTDVQNYAILQNYNSAHYTLVINGSFPNYGTVRNHPNGYSLTINAYDDVLNYGTWTCNALNLYGDDAQNISFGAEHTFQGAYLNDMNNTAGIYVTGDDLYLENSSWDLNSVSLYLTPGDFDWIMANSVLIECDIISNLNSNLNMTANSRIGNVSFQSITNLGTLMFQTDLVFSGELVNNGFVQNYNSFHRTLTVQGDITNTGTIRNHPSGYDLSIIAGSDVINSGTFSNNTLTMAGAQSQLISFPLNHDFFGTYFYDTDASSPLTTNSDLYFTNTNLDLNNAQLMLLPGGYDLNLDNCVLTDANIHSDETSLFNPVNNSRIYTTGFESITTTGVVTLASNTTISGNLVNLGTIQNLNTFYYTLNVQGNLDNQGTIRKHLSGYNLILNCSQQFTNSGTINIDTVYLNGVASQNISNTGTISLQSLIDSTPASSLVLLTDLSLSNTQVDLNASTLVLNSGSRTGKTLTMHGGNLRNANIIGGNDSGFSFDSNAYVYNVTADELLMNGTVMVYSAFTVDHLINHATVKNHPNFYYTLNVTLRLDNYGTIEDNGGYGLYLNLGGDMYDYGYLSNNFIDFIATEDQNIYQDASADTIRCDSIRKSSTSGDLIMLSDLNLKGCYIDMYSKNLVMHSGRTAHTLYMNGYYITRTYLATSGYSTINMTGNAYLNGIDGDDLILQGTIIIYGTSHFSNIANYAVLRNFTSNLGYLYISGNFTNYGSTLNASQSFYIYTAGDLFNYGTLANQQIYLNSIGNQSATLNGTQTFGFITLVSNNGVSLWYRNGEDTGLSGTSLNFTANDSWLFGSWQPYNTTTEIWGRTISIGTGTAVSAPENLLIRHSGENIILQWNQVTNANTYNIYSSDSPDSGFNLLEGGLTDPNPEDGIVSHTLPDTPQRKFYQVTAEN